MKYLEQETARFLEKLESKGGPEIHEMPIAEARKLFELLQGGHPLLPAEIEDRMISFGEGRTVLLHIVRPPGTAGKKLPVVFYFHGGGWVMGSPSTHERFVREIACGARAAVVFVHYSLSPEVKYPTALEEASAAIRYVAEHAESLNLDAHRFALAGDSAGGNMTAALLLFAKEHIPRIRCQILLCPSVDTRCNTPSYRKFAADPWLTTAAMHWYWNAYVPAAADREKPTVSPLRASLKQLRNHPPALIITAENDVLRDEAENYARKLTRAGVSATAVRYLGTIHDFMVLNPLSRAPSSRSAVALINAYLQQAFSN